MTLFQQFGGTLWLTARRSNNWYLEFHNKFLRSFDNYDVFLMSERIVKVFDDTLCDILLITSTFKNCMTFGITGSTCVHLLYTHIRMCAMSVCLSTISLYYVDKSKLPNCFSLYEYTVLDSFREILTIIVLKSPFFSAFGFPLVLIGFLLSKSVALLL